MKKLLKVLVGIVVVLVVVVAGALFWATGRVNASMARTIDTHTVDFPIPFPLSEEEIAALEEEGEGEDLDLEAVALERAIERGHHLVEARYGCGECHGENFGGGVMVDDPMLGSLLAPNITEGAGSRAVGYGPAEWDRIVRHGVLRDRTPGVMPSEDFRKMSDQELSDIVAYIRSMPAVDNEVARPTFGPLGKMLAATGKLPLPADVIGTHDAPHPTVPPEAAVTAEFGEHLAGVCSGCHRADLSGGPIATGDPSWPPASNLTPHADGLAGWSYEDFRALMIEGRRPDGTEVLEPMTLLMPFAANMTDVEMQALWTYLQSLPARPTGT